jgi:hypothetical protein
MLAAPSKPACRADAASWRDSGRLHTLLPFGTLSQSAAATPGPRLYSTVVAWQGPKSA